MQCIQGNESPIVVTHNRRIPKLVSEEHGIINDTDRNDYAVYIRNMCKRYDTGPPIVNNLSMNVRKGTIYGLLGSSGCGKTTILSCIVGLRNWDSGDVLVFGKTPGTKGSGIPGRRLGYMPQDLALYDHLSIREVIQFYGRLYNMTNSEITERWMFLNKLLELPGNFRLIKDLSGGQKRRASLLLALIHSPELLILDEPTVGLDPLLRRKGVVSIWNHLYRIVSTLGTTIIITTHYIEEARLSNTIGVMRKGRILVEDSPINLLYHYECELLEDVVMKLCRQDETTFGILAKSPDSTEAMNKVEFKSNWSKNYIESSVGVGETEHELMRGNFRKAVGFDCEIDQNLGQKETQNKSEYGLLAALCNLELFKMCQRIYGFAVVMMLTFLRFPALLILILFIPAIQGSLTILCLGSKMRDMHLGIVNHELTNWTQECDLPVHATNSCVLSALSCKFLNELKSNDLFILDSYDTEHEALTNVHLGNAWGYLTFPSNYSQHCLDVAAARYFAFNESLEGSRIHVHLDYSQYIASFFMLKHMFTSFMQYVHQLAKTCQIGDQEVVLPIHYRPPVFGTYEDDYVSFILPGVIVSSLMVIVSSLTGLIYVADYKRGTLSRAKVAGLSTIELMLSHLITQGIVTVGQIIIWSGLLHFVFHFVIQGSVVQYLVFCMLCGICGTIIGMLIGVVCRDEVKALVLAVFLLPIFLLYGGVIFPTESMPIFWQNFGSWMPTTLPTSALRSIIVRGLEWNHRLVWPGIGVVILWTVGCAVLTIFAYRKFCK